MQAGQVPRRLRQAAQPRKDGVGEDAIDHGADAAGAVAEPAEEPAPTSGADQPGGGDPAVP